MAKWSRQHEQARTRIMELLAEVARPFADMSDEAVAERRALPALEWCHTYLPHYCTCAFAPGHRRMMDAIGAPGMPTFIGAFRGFGKSVLANLGVSLRRCLSGRTPFDLQGAMVLKLAMQNMDYIRIELEHNARIRADYGDLRVDGPAEAWVCEFPDAAERPFASCKFEAFGIGMSPRGRRHGVHRPYGFTGDDLESAELARSSDRERNLWNWMFDEVLPALEPKVYVFCVVGTMYGPGCMLVRAEAMAKRADDTGRPLARHFIQMATDDGRSVWPERFSDDDLARIRAQVGTRIWRRNYDLSAEDPDKPFQASWLGEYKHVDTGGLDVVAFLDPAISESANGCPRALICVGADRLSGKRYVLDAWLSRGTPADMIGKLFEFYKTWHPRVIGIEINGGYALIRPLVEVEQSKRGTWLPIRYINHSRPKDLRIEMLCPQVEAGRWLFPENPSAGVKALQDQLLNYPDGFVDGPDAAAGCDELLPDAFRPQSGGPEYKSLGTRRQLAGIV